MVTVLSKQKTRQPVKSGLMEFRGKEKRKRKKERKMERKGRDRKGRDGSKSKVRTVTMSPVTNQLDYRLQ